MNPIAQYYREELNRTHADFLRGETTKAHVDAVCDEYIDWMRHRKATAPKGSPLRKLRIPSRGYLLRALA